MDAADTPISLRLQSLFGLAAFLALAYALGCWWGRRRNAVPWRLVAWGVGLQFAFAALILLTVPGRWAFAKFDRGVQLLLQASTEGAALLFGNLARGNDLPTTGGGAAEAGAFFAFNILPTIVFFSALLAVLYHTGLMHLVVGSLAWVMRRTMGTSGAETLAAASNVFVGQTEAPLFVRPFLATMTRSELNAVMVGGFANIASGVLAFYAGMLDGLVDDAGAHLLAASVISAPAGLVVAKLLVPETQTPQTAVAGVAEAEVERPAANLLDAAVRGTRDGLVLAANVGAVLIVFTGLVWLFNAVLGAACDGLNDALKHAGITASNPVPILSLQDVLGRLLWPAAWLCGLPAGALPGGRDAGRAQDGAERVLRLRPPGRDDGGRPRGVPVAAEPAARPLRPVRLRQLRQRRHPDRRHRRPRPHPPRRPGQARPPRHDRRGGRVVRHGVRGRGVGLARAPRLVTSPAAASQNGKSACCAGSGISPTASSPAASVTSRTE